MNNQPMNDESIKEEDQSMHRIIRLKRYEQPPEGYYQDFLREFHHRQRAELLKPSISTLLMERFSSFLSEFRVPTFAYAGATAVAILTGIVVWENPAVTSTQAPVAYAASYSPRSASAQSPYSQTPVTIDRMQPVSLRLDMPTGRNASQLFPTSYLLQASPANHESPLSF